VLVPALVKDLERFPELWFLDHGLDQGLDHGLDHGFDRGFDRGFIPARLEGIFWWEVDVTYYVVWLLARLGIVWDLRRSPLGA